MNPRLVEDQREAQQRLSKKALLATNPTQVNLNEKEKYHSNILGRVCPGQLSVLHQGCHKQVCNAGIAGPGLNHASFLKLTWEIEVLEKLSL